MRTIELVGRTGDQRGNDGGQQESAGWAGGLGEPDVFGPAVAPGPRQFTSRLKDTFAVRRARGLAHIEDLRSAAPPDAEAIRKARALGERYVASELAECLGPDSTLFLGYQNSAGAIGQLLACRHGLVAMKSLFLNATVHCDRDDWRADRFDDFEQFLGALSLDDRAGRSPSAQINQPADVLEEQLRAADMEIGVLRVIVLNHPRSRRGNCRRPTVEIFASTADFVTWLKKMPPILDRADLAEIEDVIVRGQPA